MMIFAVGEVLIDFIAVEEDDLKDVRVFENILAALRRIWLWA